MRKLSEINESLNLNPKGYDDMPHITTLGDGRYTGTMSGYALDYNGKKYKCSFGVRGFNCPMTIVVENGEDKRG